MGPDDKAAIALFYDHMFPHGIGEISDQSEAFGVIAMFANLAAQAGKAPPPNAPAGTRGFRTS